MKNREYDNWNVQCPICKGYLPIGRSKPEMASMPVPRHFVNSLECSGGGLSVDKYTQKAKLPKKGVKVELWQENKNR